MKKKWSQRAHDTWQIDGKELVKLGNGKKVSWMNIGDEGSSAHLNVYVDTHARVGQISPSQMTQRINESFKRWGLPKEIKIDNGHPFVNTSGKDYPTKTILWWIGLGIKVTQNRPRNPQENGIVECLQGIMNSWSNPQGQMSIKALQKRLDKESDFQRNHYQLRSRNYKTRIQLYPELETNSRKYNPSNFDIKQVDQYLSKKVWRRPIGKNGQIKFGGENEYLGIRYSGIDAIIIYDPMHRTWVISKEDGSLLKTSIKRVPNKNEILKFALANK